MDELLVDRADQFDRNGVETERKEAPLAIDDAKVAEKVCKRTDRIVALAELRAFACLILDRKEIAVEGCPDPSKSA
ncbi:hypothetical protein HGG75_26095 [Ochrobactrum pseudogrignonense]|nr:hypothetical protein [Brucella pseudogrignonensis]